MRKNNDCERGPLVSVVFLNYVEEPIVKPFNASVRRCVESVSTTNERKSSLTEGFELISIVV